jgi:hypothetical protein
MPPTAAPFRPVEDDEIRRMEVLKTKLIEVDVERLRRRYKDDFRRARNENAKDKETAALKKADVKVQIPETSDVRVEWGPDGATRRTQFSVLTLHLFPLQFVSAPQRDRRKRARDGEDKEEECVVRFEDGRVDYERTKIVFSELYAPLNVKLRVRVIASHRNDAVAFLSGSAAYDAATTEWIQQRFPYSSYCGHTTAWPAPLPPPNTPNITESIDASSPVPVPSTSSAAWVNGRPPLRGGLDAARAFAISPPPMSAILPPPMSATPLLVQRTTPQPFRAAAAGVHVRATPDARSGFSGDGGRFSAGLTSAALSGGGAGGGAGLGGSVSLPSFSEGEYHFASSNKQLSIVERPQSDALTALLAESPRKVTTLASSASAEPLGLPETALDCALIQDEFAVNDDALLAPPPPATLSEEVL